MKYSRKNAYLTSVSDLDLGCSYLQVVCDIPSSDDAFVYDVSWNSLRPFRSCVPDKEKGTFEVWPILVTVTLQVGTYKWHETHHLVVIHVSMKFHEILKEKGIFDLH